MFINAAVILTMGVFLSGYIVLLGGSDFLVGMLNNSVTWAAFVALFSFLIYEKREMRKKLLICLSITSRLLMCSIILLPLILKDKNIVLIAVTVMVICANILWGIYNVGSTAWFINILPQGKEKSSYIYLRMFLLRISFTVSTIAMGFVLDYFQKSYKGFVIVFITSLILSIIDIVILANVKEPANEVDKDKKFTLELFLEPIRNKKFRGFLSFIFVFYFCLGMSSSFTPLYQIRYLKLDYSFISIINVISYIALIVFTGLWSKIETRKGLLFVFRVTSMFIICELLLYSFLTKSTIYILLLSPIIGGIGYSGFNVSVMTYRFDIIPKVNRTIYEGWFGAVLGTSMFISPILGGILLENLPVINNSIYQNSNFQFLYLISFILGAFVIFRMLSDKNKFI